MSARILHGLSLVVAFPLLFLSFAIEDIGEAIHRAGDWLGRLAVRIERPR